MQKKLIALVVAGVASTAAFAQSNVTIYGQINPSYDYITYKEAAGTKQKITNMNDNASRIGFKGEESLGNGLKAIFQLESYFDAVNGDSGAGVAGFQGARDTYVGLESSMLGTVKFGSMDQVYKKISSGYDLFADSLGDYNTIMTNGLGSRDPKSAWYTSPKLAGFQGHVSYALENAKQTGNATAYNNDAILSYGVTYDLGGLNLLATHVTNNDDASKHDKANKIGVKYTFANKASIAALAEKIMQNDNTTSIKSANNKRWFIAGAYPITGNINLIANYAKKGDDKITTATDGARMYTLGAEYLLSKRTKVAAIYNNLKNDTGGTTGYDSGYSPIAAGAKANGFSARIQHNF